MIYEVDSHGIILHENSEMMIFDIINMLQHHWCFVWPLLPPAPRHRAMPQALRAGRGAQGPLLPHQEAIGGTAGDAVGATHGQTWRGTGTLGGSAQLRWEEREDFSINILRN
jgi:hypothetical protein